jgi:thiol:disulfide interchange protein
MARTNMSGEDLLKVHIKVFATAVFCLLLIATKAGYSQGPFDPHRDAKRDLDAAKGRAAAEHKRILLDFGANWCGPCVTLEHLFDTDPNINRSLNAGFILVKVPIEIEKDSAATQAVRNQYPKFDVVPHLLVVDPSGKQVWDQPSGPLMSNPKKGVWSRQAVLRFLDKWGGQGNEQRD